MTVTGTIFFITSCIVKTLAFSITLRSKETLSAFKLTVVALKARLASYKKIQEGVNKQRKWLEIKVL